MRVDELTGADLSCAFRTSLPAIEHVPPDAADSARGHRRRELVSLQQPRQPLDRRAFVPPALELLPDGGSVLDVGCGDGDVGFLFHDLGCDVDLLDNAATNFNDVQGAKRTAEALGHRGRIIERDIDFGFELDRDYDLVLFLGTLYHLRNPALALIRLAQRCERMLISTRITRELPGVRPAARLDASDCAVAYLLDRRQANDDPTNWWIFSPAGLLRLLKRCGWMVTESTFVGAVGKGSPADAERDERMFAVCTRVVNHAELARHHDF